MSTQGYKEASKRTAPKKGTLGKALWAFVSGGVMGIIGQGQRNRARACMQQRVKKAHMGQQVRTVLMHTGGQPDPGGGHEASSPS